MGAIFKVTGWVVYVVGGLWGSFICLGIIFENLGFVGGLLALFLLPVTLLAAPLYAGFVDDNWFPMLLIYGSGIMGTGLVALGSVIEGE